jgi:hypothetical protein
MMTQNIPQRLFEFEMVVDGYCNNYHNYCVLYLYFGLHVYLTIVVAAIYNIESISSRSTLGAYTKTPIDLSSEKVLWR